MKTLFGATLLCGMLLLGGCGGGGGTSTTPTTPTSFQGVSENLNEQSLALTLSTKNFAEKFNALSEFDPSNATGDAIVAPLDDMIAAGEVYLKGLQEYQALLEKYHSYTAAKTTQKISLRQSVDPLFVLDVANLINTAKSEADLIHTMQTNGKDEADIQQAVNDYKTKNLGKAVNFGFSSLMGAGAGGLAATAVVAGATVMSAPVVLTATAVGIGVGVVVGGFVSWCTSSGGMTRGADSVCSMTSITTQAIQLPNGEIGFAVSLPQGGPGTLCLHTEGKSPLCIETTVGSSGNTIDLGCWDSEYDPTKATECNTQVEVDEGVAINGGNCATDVFSLSASPVVSGGATVNVNTTLPTEGCTISYSLIGTDGYTQSGSLSTDASGHISFYVPAGADGVFDSVSLVATESGVTTTAGYTF